MVLRKLQLSQGLWMCPYLEIGLVAQLVKNPPAMQETRVQSLSREDPLEKKWKPSPVFLPGESHGQRSLVGYGPGSHKKSDTSAVTKNASMQCGVCV